MTEHVTPTQLSAQEIYDLKIAQENAQHMGQVLDWPQPRIEAAQAVITANFAKEAVARRDTPSSTGMVDSAVNYAVLSKLTTQGAHDLKVGQETVQNLGHMLHWPDTRIESAQAMIVGTLAEKIAKAGGSLSTYYAGCYEK